MWVVDALVCSNPLHLDGRTVSQHHSFLAQEVKRQQELPSQADIVDEWLTTVIQFGWVAPPAILPRSRVVTVLCVCVCARARVCVCVCVCVSAQVRGHVLCVVPPCPSRCPG